MTNEIKWRELRIFLCDSFSKSEIEDLIFDLGYDINHFNDKNTKTLVRNFLAEIRRKKPMNFILNYLNDCYHDLYIEAFPTVDGTSTLMTPNDYFERAARYFKEERYDDAQVDLDLLTDWPDLPQELRVRIFTLLGDIRLASFRVGNHMLGGKYVGTNMESFQLAVEYYTKAIQIDPSCIEAYYGRASCYYLLSDRDTYLRQYDLVIEITPKDGQAYLKRAVAIINYHPLSYLFSPLFPSHPMVTLAREALIEFSRPSIFDTEFDRQSLPDVTMLDEKFAFSHWKYKMFRFALEKIPDQPDNYFLQGALSDFAQALNFGLENTQEAYVHYVRGELYYYCKKYELAVADFDKAAEVAVEIEHVELLIRSLILKSGAQEEAATSETSNLHFYSVYEKRNSRIDTNLEKAIEQLPESLRDDCLEAKGKIINDYHREYFPW